MKKVLISFAALIMSVSLVCAGALTAPRNTTMKTVNSRINVGVYTNTIVYAGSMVAVNSSGYLVEASDAASIQVIGYAMKTVDNTTSGSQPGASGAQSCDVQTGNIYWNQSDANSYSNKSVIGQIAYVANDQTVSVSASGLSYNAIAGVVVDWDPLQGVCVAMGVVPVAGSSAFSSLTVTNAITAGSISDGGTLAVTGATTLNSTLSIKGSLTCTNGVVSLSNLPTSTNGLATGTLWNNSGALSVKP